MTNPRYDKVIVKLIAMLVIIVAIIKVYDIQMEALRCGINGTLRSCIIGFFCACIGAVVTIVVGKRKKD